SKFVAGVTAQMIARAHHLQEPAAYLPNDAVRYVEAEGLVDGLQIVDGKHKESARLGRCPGPREDRRKRFNDELAVDEASLRIVRAEIKQPLFMASAFLRQTYDAKDLGGASVQSGKPASGILHPYGCASACRCLAQ